MIVGIFNVVYELKGEQSKCCLYSKGIGGFS
jgi:hypothetical protein